MYRCELESLLSVDEGVKKVVDALRAKAELSNTVLIYTSDNGYFHGEHRIPKDKQHIYEESIRVPLLMRGPGIPQGVNVGDLRDQRRPGADARRPGEREPRPGHGRALADPGREQPGHRAGTPAPDRGAELHGDPDRALHVRRAPHRREGALRPAERPVRAGESPQRPRLRVHQGKARGPTCRSCAPAPVRTAGSRCFSPAPGVGAAMFGGSHRLLVRRRGAFARRSRAGRDGARSQSTKSKSKTIAADTNRNATAKCQRGSEAVSGGFAAPRLRSHVHRALDPALHLEAEGQSQVEDPGPQPRRHPVGAADLVRILRHARARAEGQVQEEDAAAFDPGSATARCPRGSEVVSGGFASPDARPHGGDAVFTFTSKRKGQRKWKVSAYNNDPVNPQRLVAFAYCDEDQPGLRTRSANVNIPLAEKRSRTAECRHGRKAYSGGYKGSVDTNRKRAVPVRLEARQRRRLEGECGWERVERRTIPVHRVRLLQVDRARRPRSPPSGTSTPSTDRETGAVV